MNFQMWLQNADDRPSFGDLRNDIVRIQSARDYEWHTPVWRRFFCGRLLVNFTSIRYVFCCSVWNSDATDLMWLIQDIMLRLSLYCYSTTNLISIVSHKTEHVFINISSRLFELCNFKWNRQVLYLFYAVLCSLDVVASVAHQFASVNATALWC